MTEEFVNTRPEEKIVQSFRCVTYRHILIIPTPDWFSSVAKSLMNIVNKVSNIIKKLRKLKKVKKVKKKSKNNNTKKITKKL